MNKHVLAAASAAFCLAGVQPALAAFQLEVTEIWFGNAAAPDATQDWFEVTNTGSTSWVAATHGNLYFDDDSANPTVAVPLSGVSSIAPGQSVIFVAGGATGGSGFSSFWGPVVSLPPIGTYTGPGLGAGAAGDAVALWIGATPPAAGAPPLVLASYPDPAGSPGASYDVRLGAFSVVGNAAQAVSKDSVPPPPDPTTASPGDSTTVPSVAGVALRVTEIWPGNNVNPDVTTDWFEVTNIGTTAWVAASDGNLYYDDSSASPAAAVLLTGVANIQPGESVIFVETVAPVGVPQFEAFWEPIFGNLKVGTYSGSQLSLSLNGDAITLWQSSTPPVAGDAPLISAAFPLATSSNGSSYDVTLASFSANGNSSGAVTVPRQGLPPEPTIASPGTVAPTGAASVPFPGWMLAPALAALAALLRRRRPA